MKLTNLTKSVLAASALTVASFGADASVIANASIDIKKLKVEVYDAGQSLLSLGQFNLSNVGIAFGGTSVSTTLNANNDGSSFTDIVSDPFSALSVDINSNLSSGISSADAHSGITGNIFSTTGANGNTSSSVKAYGNSQGDANSQIINNLDASFTFGVDQSGYVKINFDWFINTYVSIFDQGGEGNADWGLTVTLKEKNCTGFSCSNLYNFDLTGPTQLNTSQTGTLNTIGDIWNANANGVESSDFISLTAGTIYSLNIAQSSNSTANSVPEPTSVAILGLGLLGFAGAARRRKS